MTEQSIASGLELPPFGLIKGKKREILFQGLLNLVEHHKQGCPPYSAMIDALWREAADAKVLEDIPWLPVRIFKMMDLHSVPVGSVVRTLVSSGTTGAAVSRIHLDSDTARNQTRALAKIFSEFAGTKRMPMLILDNNAFMHDRSRFNARAAGILGFSNFGRDHHYALDESLAMDWEALDQWLSRQGNQPILLFGFTFIIWKSFFEDARSKGIKFALPKGSRLVHGGGWKKMTEQSVDNATFKQALYEAFELAHVHNYYGMVEQVGSVFFECEEGHLHAPAYADVIIRDDTDLAPLPFGNPGLVQVLRML